MRGTFPWPGASALVALVALAAVALALSTATCALAAQPGSPDLVVVIAVDQLMPDHLERYDAAFEGGLRTLLDEGFTFRDAVHDHAITYTSPGHASIATGVVPARHGIVGNSWREWRDGDWVNVSSVADPATRLVGGSGSGSSPMNLLVNGLPDWILQAHPESRVVSLSGKNTTAVLLAGRARGDVYWFSLASEGFVTSTYYGDALPDWVERANREGARDLGDGRCWESDLAPEVAALSRRDTVAYELDGVHTHFPHCVDDSRFRSRAHFVSRTPYLDTWTLALAREAVDALELGRRGPPDYLALGLSSTDRVGHDYGPWSREQLANLVGLDRELGAFFQFLDERVGRDRYVVVLTSDHGVLPLPEYLEELGEFGVRLPAGVGPAFRQAADEVGLAPPRGGGAPGGEGSEAAQVRERLARALEELEWVAGAMPLELLAGEAPADSFVVLYRNSFHPRRLTTNMARYGVEVRPHEGVLSGSTGTTHGQPYLHDRRVPLVVSGGGIGAGRSDEPARTVDIAPTLARILGIEVPEDLDGRTLTLPGSARR